MPRISPHTNDKPRPRRSIRQRRSSFAVSLVVHAVLLVAMGLWVDRVVQDRSAVSLALDWADTESSPNGTPTDKPVVDVQLPADRSIASTAIEHRDPLPQTSVAAPVAPKSTASRRAARSTLSGDATGGPQFVGGLGSLAGRTRDARGRLAGEGGGTPGSEDAVERGLKWLLAHQNDDGSWHFDHTSGVCNGYCRNAGTERSTTAATAMALMCFYGAGYTHREGEHQMAVARGLYYLGSRMLVTPQGGDLQEGTLYAQGISAIVLCEAYAMSGDEKLKPYAQSALDFIVYAQDHKGGGWRYFPGQPGDTTSFGWQLMALKSGHIAGLQTPSPTLFAAAQFLDSVQSDGGAGYGYQTPVRRDTTTAVGLLCRMYTGWKRDHPALVRGVASLAEVGPIKDNMYFNFYATQVLHHFGGPAWERWNPAMREHLLATQATDGHEAGSWYFAGGRGEVGGRLYNTAMAILTLEVYYRYLPLYREEAVERGF